MSVGDLQSWLLEEGINNDLDILTHRTVRTELDNLVDETEGMIAANIDWHRLLFAGSILARSDKRAHQEAALRIATGAVTQGDSQPISDAGAVLFGKLSNFRAIELANQRDLLKVDLDGRLGMALRIEAQRRQIEQSILVESSGRWLSVNEFQQRFWKEASGHRWLSASAPTASGKTFLVLQWLIDQMHASEMCVAVYLAPTRALVSEIESSLRALLGEKSTIDASSLPLRDKYDVARRNKSKLILVFTERLHLLANVLRDEAVVDMLIVDEAHKIGDNQRGVILQDAIERTSRANPAVKVVFISPATQNPEVLLADAPEGASKLAIESEAPTVLQNLLVAEQVPRKPKLWTLSAPRSGSSLPIGVLQLANSPAGPRKRLAFIAAAAGERGGTLVYANGAAESEHVANLISQLMPRPKVVDEELMDLADLARKGVHPRFSLAPLVERGVERPFFHPMPSNGGEKVPPLRFAPVGTTRAHPTSGIFSSSLSSVIG